LNKAITGTVLCVLAVGMGEFVATQGGTPPRDSLLGWDLIAGLVLIVGLGLIANHLFTRSQ